MANERIAGATSNTYFYYANMDSIELNPSIRYAISINDDIKFVGNPSVMDSLYLNSSGIYKYGVLQLYGSTKITSSTGKPYYMTMKLLDKVKLNSDHLFEDDNTQSVLILTLEQYNYSDIEETQVTFNLDNISIYKYDKAIDISDDNNYSLDELPKVTVSVERLYKTRLLQRQLAFDHEDKLNRLIDRSVHTPDISRHKFSIPVTEDIKLHPGERYHFYIPGYLIRYNRSYSRIYTNNINSMGNKTVLIKFTNVLFAIFSKDTDGTYTENITASTLVPSIIINCNDGFSVFGRGTKIAVSVMDDGRVDIVNAGENSIIIPRYTDESLNYNDMNKYNMMYFEINWLGHNTIARSDYGFMSSRDEYNSLAQPFEFYSNDDSAYESLICDEAIWYDKYNNKFKVHVDINRSLVYNIGSNFYKDSINCSLHQIYIKWPNSKSYELVKVISDYDYGTVDCNTVYISYVNTSPTSTSMFEGYDFELEDQDKILNLKYGEIYKFSVKIVDQFGNIDIRHYRIIPSSEEAPIVEHPLEPPEPQ